MSTAARDLADARESLASATARLRQQLDGRRPSVPPEAAPFESATRILAAPKASPSRSAAAPTRLPPPPCGSAALRDGDFTKEPNR